jgi:hypothetical protein
MASNTQATKKKRANKVKAQGRKRKNQLASKGTTQSREELFKVVEA